MAQNLQIGALDTLNVRLLSVVNREILFIDCLTPFIYSLSYKPQHFLGNLIRARFLLELNSRGVPRTVCAAEPEMTYAEMGWHLSLQLTAATVGVMNIEV